MNFYSTIQKSSRCLGIAWFRLSNVCLFVCALLLISTASSVFAQNSLNVEVMEEDATIEHYPAKGDQLVLVIAPSYGFNERWKKMSKVLSDVNIEIWMIDLLDSFFKHHSVDNIREIDAKFVADLINKAHEKTGKNITLLTSSYGAIPVLRGIRQWQLSNRGLRNVYLNGVILFSPELYMGVPVLGDDPEFEPITSSTNIPIMIYQSEIRNNRWQLDNVITRLEKNNAVVRKKILPGIASLFHDLVDVPDSRMQEIRNMVFAEIPDTIKWLQSTPTPIKAAELEVIEDRKTVGLDFQLRKYTGTKTPLPLDLITISGERIVRDDYRNKVTVVNFWATWCPPCVEEIPMLNRLKEAMKEENFELLSVNYGEREDIINEFIKKVKIQFPVLLDEGGRVSGQWNTIILPSTFVIGPDGKFAYAVNAAIEWDSPAVINAMKQLARQAPHRR